MSAHKGFSTEITDGLPELPGVTQHTGVHLGAGKRFGIVAGRFNATLTGPAVESAVHVLIEHGVEPPDIEVVWVPGSFEILLPLRRLASSGRFDALIPVGVVLEGATRHADLIMNTLVERIAQLSLEFDCPIIDAVVSARTIEQAEERCLTGRESRAAYAAFAAMEMATTPREFS